jgi:chromate reductase
MVKLVGISGSLRAASFNSALLRAAIELTPTGVELIVGDIRAIPLYDGDLEASDGIPAAVSTLKDLIAASDGLAVMGASPGGFGTILSQNAWLPVLRTLGTDPWFGGRLMVSRASGLFGPNGELTDEATRKNLRVFLEGFATFAASRQRPSP